MTIALAAAAASVTASKPRRRGVRRYIRIPQVVRRQMPPCGFEARERGNETDTTSSAEQMKPRAVPENSQWKLMTVSKAAATAGLVRLSMSYANRESDKPLVYSASFGSTSGIVAWNV